ncbi:hypothetical protein GCM10007989_17100 [Devosia pacifica]|uniref:Peptidase S74 domain-containing protein n=1 Tax=Devosia pacifica TaxID=1335967 RepID=A0A918S635_9HYPH|nr:DUF2793 domain-containing protein [Devosia pacifica]GHA22297.1 hypothetical protein GCM10007989_17100 [Devosia pacifica]
MDSTYRLDLPILAAQQAQKHITHNEALLRLDALVQPVVRDRDRTTPPAAPVLGDAHIVGDSASGGWAGHDREIAMWQAGAWAFLDPAEGWQAYCATSQQWLVFQDGDWVVLAGNGPAGVPQIGINAASDATNRLSIAAEASLFSHDGAGHQLKLNKADASETASLLYQSDFVGHAEMGLAGDTDWQLKVSSDGASWVEALRVAAASGAITIAADLAPASDDSASLGHSGARWHEIWAATGTIQTSDKRAKCDIADSELGLSFILGLRPVSYRIVADGPRHHGLIAQEVGALLERMGVGDFAGHVKPAAKDANGHEGLRYESFIAPLISAIQTLNTRIATLESERKPL